MKILIITILALSCQSCIDSITVRGRFADYIVKPHKPLQIEHAK